MASVPEEPNFAAEEANRLVNLQLIVTHNPDAVSQLKHAYESKGLPNEGLKSEYGFLCYGTQDDASSLDCDCWFDLEYFTFIQETLLDVEIFNKTLENLQRGKCPHVIQREKNGEDISGCRLAPRTTLLHAAAAAGNEDVVKYLTKTFEDFIYKSSNGGLKPLHLALLKSQVNVFKYLYGRKQDSADENFINFDCNSMKLTKRDSSNGELTRYICPSRAYRLNLTTIIKLYDITDAVLILESMTFIDPHSITFSTDLLPYFLLSNQESLSVSMLTNSQFNILDTIEWVFAWEVVVLVCALTDADQCLQVLIKNGVPLDFESYGYTMLDVAQAFGSQRCSTILREYLSATQGIYTTLSPFRFLLLADENFGVDMVSLELVQRCQQQGFDINYIDRDMQCPLVYAINLGRGASTLQTFIEAGSDIDRADSYAHLIRAALCQIHVSKFPADIDVLKIILRFNPSRTRTDDTLILAVKYDLENVSRLLKTTKAKFKLKLIGENTTKDDSDDHMFFTSKERFMSSSAFAMLYELGFPVNKACLDFIEERRDSDTIAMALYKFVAEEVYRPRSLVSSCRIVLRNTFLGTKLKTYLSHVGAPCSAVDFLTRPYFLTSV